MQHKIILSITMFQKQIKTFLIKTTLFCLLFIGTIAGKKQDTPHHVLFQPVLKAYQTWHSWIITAHMSPGDLNTKLHMFNHQKTLAHQLLVKLQGQPLASLFILMLF